jgi:hypothetical protein
LDRSNSSASDDEHDNSAQAVHAKTPGATATGSKYQPRTPCYTFQRSSCRGLITDSAPRLLRQPLRSLKEGFVLLVSLLLSNSTFTRLTCPWLALGVLLSPQLATAGTQAAIVSHAGSEQSILASMGRLTWQTFLRVTTESASTKQRANSEPFHSTCGMDERMVSLFLQSYNAGPYAVLRFRGNVPYRETRSYTPKVLRFYQQDLSHTPYDHMIERSAQRHGLDPQLIRAIIKAESNFRNRTTSHAGARGLMQVMPVTWNAVRKRNGIDWSYSGNVFDPAKNIEVACAYLSWIRYEHLPAHFAEFREPAPGTTPDRETRMIARQRQQTGPESLNRQLSIRVADSKAIRPIPGAVSGQRKSNSDQQGIQFSWSQ